jgi:hypothetical protein
MIFTYLTNNSVKLHYKKKEVPELTSLLEAVNDVMKTFIDEDPKPPLHVGEIMNCWTYLTMLEEEQANVQIGT